MTKGELKSIIRECMDELNAEAENIAVSESYDYVAEGYNLAMLESIQESCLEGLSESAKISLGGLSNKLKNVAKKAAEAPGATKKSIEHATQQAMYEDLFKDVPLARNMIDSQNGKPVGKTPEGKKIVAAATAAVAVAVAAATAILVAKKKKEAKENEA